jgi:hypothetical protein
MILANFLDGGFPPAVTGSIRFMCFDFNFIAGFHNPALWVRRTTP